MVTDRYMARVYIQQARETPHRGWAFVLLGWAGDRRRAALAAIKRPAVPVQAELF